MCCLGCGCGGGGGRLGGGGRRGERRGGSGIRGSLRWGRGREGGGGTSLSAGKARQGKEGALDGRKSFFVWGGGKMARRRRRGALRKHLFSFRSVFVFVFEKGAVGKESRELGITRRLGAKKERKLTKSLSRSTMPPRKLRRLLGLLLPSADPQRGRAHDYVLQGAFSGGGGPFPSWW